MSDERYPEHEKIDWDRYHAIHDFIDYLGHRPDFFISTWHSRSETGLRATENEIENSVLGFFGVNRFAMELEARKIFEDITAENARRDYRRYVES